MGYRVIGEKRIIIFEGRRGRVADIGIPPALAS
jgi:hypothetical protein